MAQNTEQVPSTPHRESHTAHTYPNTQDHFPGCRLLLHNRYCRARATYEFIYTTRIYTLTQPHTESTCLTHSLYLSSSFPLSSPPHSPQIELLHPPLWPPSVPTILPSTGLWPPKPPSPPFLCSSLSRFRGRPESQNHCPPETNKQK